MLKATEKPICAVCWAFPKAPVHCIHRSTIDHCQVLRKKLELVAPPQLGIPLQNLVH